MKLMGKVFISVNLEVVTGLSIGGSKNDVMIGGIDSSVIKTHEGVPYIPGSSLKGKLRSLLEKTELDRISQTNGICKCGNCSICAIFGTSADTERNKVGPNRLIVRDAFLDKNIQKDMENKKGRFKDLELIYTEGKWENVIDRVTSKADHPRQTERVPVGAIFNTEFVFNYMGEKDGEYLNEIIKALRLVEGDYIGSNGSRGYGRVKFDDLSIKVRTIGDYKNNQQGKEIYSGNLYGLNKEDLDKKLKVEFLGVE
ncbi:type III-A CRISPR-associated RAMP protein Csm3 [Clostridium sp. D2Q-14]|uniref:type III-A CRISPR-associated RAMP protein Csm3 n=1 Tax=Anaeromonas gelatinilytica TaxID=2683194 RepID=UPI00193C7431|nr:type III-A CRISPR-associated RAMP protein Csm3 [Anaeromonas gelatinilytica]MBS4534145.1 type III-A CRISPR-associated RAMP protein Csm3 [Anaeromonas gelatinilytica]